MAAFFTFENEEKAFPGVHNEMKFALCVLAPPDPDRPISMTGYVRRASQVEDKDRRYDLTPAQIESFNPNTLTAPLFHDAAAAAVLTRLHDRPVLMDHRPTTPADARNVWDATFVSLFHMGDDSGEFWQRTSGDTLTHPDGQDVTVSFDGNVAADSSGTVYVPLVEGKMLWHYDHRYGTYEDATQKQLNKGVLPHTSADDKADPTFVPMPKFWLTRRRAEAEFSDQWDRDWVIPFRDTGPSERSFVAAVTPRLPTGRNNAPILVPGTGNPALFYAMIASFPFDFALRAKSNRMALFRVEQAPVLHPEMATDKTPWDESTTIEDFITPRVAELTYTAHDLSPWAADIGYSGQPFRWDTDRRPVLQAEIDAAMFHLYGLDRSQTEFVLNSFKVLRSYEEKPPEKDGHGEFRTKRLVLERYDAMVGATTAGQPYQCPFDVPPANDSIRHDES